MEEPLEVGVEVFVAPEMKWGWIVETFDWGEGTDKENPSLASFASVIFRDGGFDSFFTVVLIDINGNSNINLQEFLYYDSIF